MLWIQFPVLNKFLQIVTSFTKDCLLVVYKKVIKSIKAMTGKYSLQLLPIPFHRQHSSDQRYNITQQPFCSRSYSNIYRFVIASFSCQTIEYPRNIETSSNWSS